MRKLIELFVPLIPMLLCRFAEEPGSGGDGGDGADVGSGGEGEAGDGIMRHEHQEPPPGSGGGESPWYEGLNESLLTDKDREYKTLEDYVKGTQNARQKLAGKGIVVPGENATDEQKAAFRAEVAQHLPNLPIPPESAEGYEISMFKDENVGLPAERQQAITAKFHEMGLSNAHADGVMDLYAEQVAADAAEAHAAIEATRKQTEAELKQEWGAEYADRQAGIETVGKKYPSFMEKAKAVGLDAEKGFQAMMDEVARATAEDHPLGGGGGESLETVNSSIETLRKSDRFRNANAKERQQITQNELLPLYAKRDRLRKK